MIEFFMAYMLVFLGSLLAVFVILWIVVWAADRVLGADEPSKPDLRYDPLAPDSDVNVPLGKNFRYDPLSTDDDVCLPYRSDSRCLLCGDPTKTYRPGIETCDCPQRGYRPRS